MKVYCVHSRAFDFRNAYYKPLAQLAKATGHTFIFPHEQEDAVQNSQDIIRSCDLVVAEVSFPSIGMGIEIGWAHAYGKPIVAIFRQNANLSSSLHIITNDIHSYADPEEIASIVAPFLE
ncbi:MAG TPA: hypothetical protein DCW68_01400 [Rhodospirillaceae bacterium]|nr:MAG: hypothetical protein A2018_04365 [Alphaproteobacteria bacterium GWF2_58_20]HAU28753.1 hypothetical protein [Rhodospirillaceae bacterium]